jgi:hypothetical protein
LPELSRSRECGRCRIATRQAFQIEDRKRGGHRLGLRRPPSGAFVHEEGFLVTECLHPGLLISFIDNRGLLRRGMMHQQANCASAASTSSSIALWISSNVTSSRNLPLRRRIRPSRPAKGPDFIRTCLPAVKNG